MTTGLGGISEGWLYPVMLGHQTGVVPFKRILFIDGKDFSANNISRQNFHTAGENKAEHRAAIWSSIFPDLPICSIPHYIDQENIRCFFKDRTVVLLSPDNHPTRALFSDHAETLSNVLLIMGGNDGISENGGSDGTEGWAAVHCRVEGHNVTPPVTRYHEDLRTVREKLPSELSCVELAQAGQPQLLATNLLVGQAMANLLYRYLTLPLRQAVNVVETCVNSRTGDISHYGIRERFQGTLFSAEEEVKDVEEVDRAGS